MSHGAQNGPSTTETEVVRNKIAAFEGGVPPASAIASGLGDRARCITSLDPAWPGARACGTAYTVLGANSDNSGLIEAFTDAQPGDVIVFDAPGEHSTAYFGDILALAGQLRGITALVANVPIRDRREIGELGFPVFHRGTSPKSPTKDRPAQAGVQLEIEGVAIRAGDLIAADADGLVVVPLEDAIGALDAAAAVLEKERGSCDALRAGGSSRELMQPAVVQA